MTRAIAWVTCSSRSSLDALEVDTIISPALLADQRYHPTLEIGLEIHDQSDAPDRRNPDGISSLHLL